VIAVEVGFGNPQLADHAAARQWLFHEVPPEQANQLDYIAMQRQHLSGGWTSKLCDNTLNLLLQRHVCHATALP
jgi:hypothetical protein